MKKTRLSGIFARMINKCLLMLCLTLIMIELLSDNENILQQEKIVGTVETLSGDKFAAMVLYASGIVLFLLIRAAILKLKN